MLIYIVEDESNIRELESYALEKSGFQVESFENAGKFCRAAVKRIPDLIILDVMLPGQDGLSLLKNLRRRQSFDGVPIIIISAKTTELDRVKGLDLGADDYMCKPFSVMEMVSRVRARLRMSPGQEPDRIVFGEIAISEKMRTVFSGGKQVELTYKEFELLKLFMENPGIVLRRDYILNKIWGHSSTGRTLDVHIRTLRGKLGENGACIMTVRGVGYKLDQRN